MSISFFAILSILLICSQLVLGIIQQPTHELAPASAIKSKAKLRALLEDRHRHGYPIEHSREENAKSSSSSSGLVFDVIHRQHPSSPYRQASKSHEEVMQEHVRRGMLRLDSLQKSTFAERTSNTMPLTREGPSALQEKVIAPAGEWQGEYLVQMQIGTPARPILLIIDTGSGLTWIQCAPCTQCFAQQEPIFDPARSTSYARVNCSHPACGASSLFQCAETHNRTCEYGVQYGSSSFSTGVVSTDTLTVDSLSGTALRLHSFLFGCGIFNQGQMVGSSGLLGLSRSAIAVPMQLAGAGLNFSRKFTHCFADLAANRNATSFMYLGDARAHQLQYTPFAVPPFRTQFYYVGLQGISVDGRRLRIPASAFAFSVDGTGGTVIDSGTTLTLLVRPAYAALRAAFRAAAARKHRLHASAVRGGFNSTVTSHVIDTCYRIPAEEFRPSRVPAVALHFAGGVDLRLPPNNVLFPFDDHGLFCLAFTGTASDVGINVIGNIQQQNFRIEYDLENSRIGFGRAYCAEDR
ncbi:aspartyl protease family protein [Marchantia polymorpha subsp. ruderalis]|uniref:Peptidase A1 domain-containing protein n=1 Tax=Marchantia polymorpha TaxID=3197 RepID=A0A2R6X2Z8_MARPO|nr:hypothetical protein MARPO_0040s0125 [Marchantia polymorpha]BBN03113.1 hypothetical protein Mp_2g20870 [Marchantia polymorpha subsp. ruderalis]|eukprot:PTQ40462.1 hypothetical protein MARPO_0040s0125 [Marchantia polymorpha]